VSTASAPPRTELETGGVVRAAPFLQRQTRLNQSCNCHKKERERKERKEPKERKERERKNLNLFNMLVNLL
jgi:hypothetical protein